MLEKFAGSNPPVKIEQMSEKEKQPRRKPLIDPEGEVGKQAAEIDELIESGLARNYTDARRILKEREDLKIGGGKSLNNEEKRRPEESQQRLRNFRLSLLDEDKLGPVE